MKMWCVLLSGGLLILVCILTTLHHRKMSNDNSRWMRVLVRIDGIDADVVQLYIPQWNPESTARISISAFPKNLRPIVETGQWLLAQAQVKSDCLSGLRLRDFEPSQVPDPNDGLA
jgi:hypothetical protein